MIYIYDTNGYKGDFGSRRTVDNYDKIANDLDLNIVFNFFRDGFAIDVPKFIEEFGSIDFSGFGEVEDLGKELLNTFKDCKGIIILSEGAE